MSSKDPVVQFAEAGLAHRQMILQLRGLARDLETRRDELLLEADETPSAYRRTYSQGGAAECADAYEAIEAILRGVQS